MADFKLQCKNIKKYLSRCVVGKTNVALKFMARLSSYRILLFCTSLLSDIDDCAVQPCQNGSPVPPKRMKFLNAFPANCISSSKMLICQLPSAESTKIT